MRHCGPAICSISSVAGKRPPFAQPMRLPRPNPEKEHLAASGYRRYQDALKTAGAVDFDDLLLLTEELFSAHPEVCQRRSRPVRSFADRRISRHQRQPVSHREGAGRRTSQLVRGRRRRPIDLRLARGRSRAHSSFPARLARGESHPPGRQLSNLRSDSGIREPTDRFQPQAARESAAGRAPGRFAADHFAMPR